MRNSTEKFDDVYEGILNCNLIEVETVVETFETNTSLSMAMKQNERL